MVGQQGIVGNRKKGGGVKGGNPTFLLLESLRRGKGLKLGIDLQILTWEERIPCSNFNI